MRSLAHKWSEEKRRAAQPDGAVEPGVGVGQPRSLRRIPACPSPAVGEKRRGVRSKRSCYGKGQHTKH